MNLTRYLVDTDILVDLSRGYQGAIEYVDAIEGDWTFSFVTSLELIAGAKNNREVEQIDRLLALYGPIPLTDSSLVQIRKIRRPVTMGQCDGSRWIHPR
jgi:predicted nucleic acid-binding protein